MATDRELVAFTGIMEAAFGSQESARLKFYHERFREFSAADLKVAAMRCANECRAFPAVRDLLDRIPGRLNEADAAEAAWTRVLTSAQEGPASYDPNVGTRPTGDDLDEATLSAIGGPSGLYRLWESESEPERMGFLRRDFLDRYKAASRMGAAGLLPDGTRPMLPNAGPDRLCVRAPDLPDDRALQAEAACKLLTATRGGA